MNLIIKKIEKGKRKVQALKIESKLKQHHCIKIQIYRDEWKRWVMRKDNDHPKATREECCIAA